MQSRRWIRMMAGLAVALGWISSGCSASHHAVEAARRGRVASSVEMLAAVDRPGPIAFETVVAADWQVARSGLINLDHPKARASGIEDGDEAISVYFHVLRHPQFGTFLVDSGVESGFRDPGRNVRVGRLVESVMRTDRLEVRQTTAEWLAGESEPLAGVFLTHIHLDHVMGLPDLPRDTPVYAGRGEASARSFLNLFTRGTIDRMLAFDGALREWQFEADASGRFEGVLDVFGDGSVWAIHVPGHTPGSTAFLVRTTAGTKLLVGDASHTRWGWENGVEPGTFSLDRPRSAASLARLIELARAYPEIEVHLGHQPLR